jgi:hypothetical protein
MARVPLRALHGRVEGPCRRNQNDAPAATRTWWHTAMPLPRSFWKWTRQKWGRSLPCFFRDAAGFGRPSISAQNPFWLSVAYHGQSVAVH